MACGPKIGRSSPPASTRKRPLVVASVPRPSAWIWWQTVHDTPSRASAGRPVRSAAVASASSANTSTGPVRAAIGMWHAAHSCWISAARSG